MQAVQNNGSVYLHAVFMRHGCETGDSGLPLNPDDIFVKSHRKLASTPLLHLYRSREQHLIHQDMRAACVLSAVAEFISMGFGCCMIMLRHQTAGALQHFVICHARLRCSPQGVTWSTPLLKTHVAGICLGV